MFDKRARTCAQLLVAYKRTIKTPITQPLERGRPKDRALDLKWRRKQRVISGGECSLSAREAKVARLSSGLLTSRGPQKHLHVMIC